MLEEEISKTEARLLDANWSPECKDDFEKLVFQSPLSSMAWLGYTAFHLARGEVEAGRSVMERALRRIPFTEEQEIQNIWFSYINLECSYGGASSLEGILQRFLKHNDKFPALVHLLKVFERCRKLEDANCIGQMIVKKHKHLPSAWISYGNFLYSTERTDEARQLLQDSAKHLQKHDQIAVTIQFAKAELKYGFSEHGIMLFEKLVASFPTRTDLWSVYADAVIKIGDNAQTSELFERILSLNIPEKKLQFLIKKQEEFKNRNMK